VAWKENSTDWIRWYTGNWSRKSLSKHRRFSMKQQVLRGAAALRAWGLPVLLATLLPLLLGGCAKVNDLGMRLVSTKVDAWLMVNGQQLTGTILLVPDRTGRATFSAENGTITNCSGSLRYSASNSAVMDLRCDDGTRLDLNATLLSETRGYGYGATMQGPSSIAFGLAEEEAQAFMGRAKPPEPAPPL